MKPLTKCYIPSEKEKWTGRNDGPDALRNHQVIEYINLMEVCPILKSKGFGILGFACDEGVIRNKGRPGAKEGPEVFREFFASLPNMSPSTPLYDFGDIICINGDLEGAQSTLAEAVALILEQKITPIVIGGGHELAWGQFQGYISKGPCRIVSFDAHYDIRPLVNGKGNSGTSFLQMYQYCKDHNLDFDYTCVGVSKDVNTKKMQDDAAAMKIKSIYSQDIHAGGMEAMSGVIAESKKNQPIYLSICLDVFASPYAPAVSAPQPLGLTPWQLIPAMMEMMKSGNVKTIGVAELNPNYDLDNCTARLTAQIVNMLLNNNI